MKFNTEKLFYCDCDQVITVMLEQVDREVVESHLCRYSTPNDMILSNMFYLTLLEQD